MEDEVKLSMKYMESVNYSPNLPPAQFPKNNIIEKKKNCQIQRKYGKGDRNRGEISNQFLENNMYRFNETEEAPITKLDSACRVTDYLLGLRGD